MLNSHDADPFIELPRTFNRKADAADGGISAPPWRVAHAYGQLLYYPARFSQTHIHLRHHLIGIEFDPGIVRIQLNAGPLIDTVVKSCSFYFVPAGSTIEVRKEHACEFILATFDPRLTKALLPEPCAAVMAEGMVDDHLTTKALELRRHLLRGDNVSQMATKLIHTAVTALTRSYQDGLRPSAYPLSSGRIRRALDFIGDHYFKKISVEDIADAVGGISPFHFAHTFKSTLGQSPHQYLVEHKLYQARTLLTHTSTNLAEIAYSVGFSSQAHMTETFSRRLGVTPAQVRRSPVA